MSPKIEPDFSPQGASRQKEGELLGLFVTWTTENWDHLWVGQFSSRKMLFFLRLVKSVHRYFFAPLKKGRNNNTRRSKTRLWMEPVDRQWVQKLRQRMIKSFNCSLLQLENCIESWRRCSSRRTERKGSGGFPWSHLWRLNSDLLMRKATTFLRNLLINFNVEAFIIDFLRVIAGPFVDITGR